MVGMVGESYRDYGSAWLRRGRGRRRICEPMHNLDLILTLTGGLAAALVLGLSDPAARPLADRRLSARRARWSDRTRPGFVADAGMAEQLAEIGVILLMFGVGLQFHLEELLAVRRVALPGAILQSLVATGLGLGVARAFGWDSAAGIVFGIALVGREHGRAHPRARRQPRPAHPRRPHRRRLARRRRPVHRAGAGAAAVARSAATRRRPASAARSPLTALKVSALVAFTALVGAARHPLAARSRRGDAVARAVHADRAGHGARHRGRRRRSSSASRWRSARSSPAWSWAAPTTACAPRPRRCRCATRSRCSSSSRSACCSIRATCCEAPLLVLARRCVVLVGKPLVAFLVVRADAVSAARVAGGRRWRWRRSASSRSSSPRSAASSACSTIEAMQRDRHRRDRLDRPEPADLPRARAGRALGVARPALLRLLDGRAARESDDDAAATKHDAARLDDAPSRGRRRLRAGGTDGDPAAARERRRADGDRAEHGHGAAPARGGQIGAVYGDAAQADTLQGRWRRTRRQPHSERRHGRQPRDHPPRARDEPVDPRARADRVSAPARATSSRPAPTRCSPARAKSRWR